MNAWVRIDDGSNIQKVGFRTVVRKQFRMNSGKIMEADITSKEGGEAACVVALTPDNQVIIARQFRCGPEGILDELPGGMIDPGETPTQAVRRELEEEVGYTSDELIPLGKAYMNAWDNTLHHYFLARNCRKVTTVSHLDEFEEIEPTIISISQLIDNAKNTQMTDVQGVFMAYDTLKELENS